MRWLGICLVWGGCVLWGLQAGGTQRRRVRVLEDVAQGLDQLRRELSLNRSALPELLERAGAHRCTQQGKSLFYDCCAELEKGNDFTHSWNKALRESWMNEAELRLLDSLSHVLGRYDAEDQVQALQRLCAELDVLSRQEGEKVRERCRVYGALGVAAGGFAALTLI